MSKLTWDDTGKRTYETGVKKGVLYVVDSSTKAYGNGVAWNGLTAVTESPEGAETSDVYADDIKYVSLISAETFGGTIEAYTYPDEFAECDGSVALTTGMNIYQQTRKKFGLVYVTTKGNDQEGDSYGYVIHIIYGCTASPSEKAYQTINDSPEAISFSWEFDSDPVNVTDHKPTSVVTIDSTKFSSTTKSKLTELEDKLFGTESTEPTLPTPDEIAEILK